MTCAGGALDVRGTDEAGGATTDVEVTGTTDALVVCTGFTTGLLWREGVGEVVRLGDGVTEVGESDRLAADETAAGRLGAAVHAATSGSTATTAQTIRDHM